MKKIKDNTLYDKISAVILKKAEYYIYSAPKRRPDIGNFIHAHRIKPILMYSERSIKALIRNEIKRQKA